MRTDFKLRLGTASDFDELLMLRSCLCSLGKIDQNFPLIFREIHHMDMLDIYTDYLICQNKYATATGLSDMVDGEFSHDKVTRFLHAEDYDSKALYDETVS